MVRWTPTQSALFSSVRRLLTSNLIHLIADNNCLYKDVDPAKEIQRPSVFSLSENNLEMAFMLFKLLCSAFVFGSFFFFNRVPTFSVTFSAR